MLSRLTQPGNPIRLVRAVRLRSFLFHLVVYTVATLMFGTLNLLSIEQGW